MVRKKKKKNVLGGTEKARGRDIPIARARGCIKLQGDNHKTEKINLQATGGEG